MDHQISHRVACCDAQMTQQMTKLLTFCIPTYKRPDTLRRCIDSIVAQIEKFKLSDSVDIYVTNDASPDDTANVLCVYESLSYFKGVTREKNLGMNVNIKCMLKDVADKSDYQFIITDDDFLQPDIMGETVAFLHEQQNDLKRVAAIWTPRYSYTEDGELYCISCSPFLNSELVSPSAFNSGRYMVNGFVLSGLVVCAQHIDFEFWEEYKENAYFPMIFFGDLLFREGAFYWHKNIVHHTVLNKCHWESWGKSDLLIEIKKFSDYVNSYGVMATRIKNHFDRFKFYFASFPTIIRSVSEFMHSDNLKTEKPLVLDAIHQQKSQGIFRIEPPLHIFMPYALFVSATKGIAKLAVLRMLLLLVRDRKRVAHYRKRVEAHLAFLHTIPIMLKLIR
jgi:glycosyltransferase involved in cell wall biosynthesis